jgi:polyhydroxybutyrate depolymerase
MQSRARMGMGLAAGLAVLLGSATGAVADTCTGTPGSSGQVEIQVGTAMRSFVVRAPKTETRTPAPVVFLFHPFGMNTQYMQGRVPLPRVWPEAIAVYGQGMPRTGGEAVSLQPAWQTRPGEMDDRDLAYFDAMLDWLRKNQCIDETRVFAMGYSNGANFTSVLACERPHALAGIAIASGSLSCSLPEAKPVILNHGLADATIRYDRAVEASRAWATRNGCSAPPKSGVLGCFKGDGCSAAPVTLCSYGGGHEYAEPFTKILADFFKAAVK